MTNKMFHTSPDIFELRIPETMQGVSIKPFESDWGTTDELLCYYEGTLVGLVAEKIKNSLFLGVPTTFVYLLPKLDQSRNYNWPSEIAFKQAVEELMKKNVLWCLHCEYDCDQRSIELIENNIESTFNAFQSALSYCLGHNFECPTFSAILKQG